MVWRIGDGNSVRVKEDKWLPQKGSRSIISPLPNILPEAKVSSLIEADRKEWKTEVIQELFLPNEASVIMGIPLSLRSTEDRIIWAYTPSGTYSTSSTYKLLKDRNVHGSSNCEPQKCFWKGLWELRVPHKIKHFIWRACHNALPTKCNLVRRNIVNSEVCELCNEGQEDVIHALWKCRVVENVWSCHSWAQQAANPPPLTFCDLFDRFVQVTDDFGKEFFAIAAWCLWNRRNALHFGCQVQPISNINLLASNLLQEFLAAQEDVALTSHPSVNQHQWRPPDHDHFKVNFDAALFKSLNLASIGVVIRD